MINVPRFLHFEILNNNTHMIYCFFADIQENVDSLEEWLEEMENTLQPLPLNSRWTKKAINEKMKELKVSGNSVRILYSK